MKFKIEQDYIYFDHSGELRKSDRVCIQHVQFVPIVHLLHFVIGKWKTLKIDIDFKGVRWSLFLIIQDRCSTLSLTEAGTAQVA